MNNFNETDNPNKLTGRIHIQYLAPFFNKDLNYRTEPEYQDDLDLFVPQLAWDGEVKDAIKIATDAPIGKVLACKFEDALVKLLLKHDTEGLRGNRRVHGFTYFWEHPDEFVTQGEVNWHVPVDLIFNLDKQGRINERQDHDAAKPLSQYGVGLSIKQDLESMTPMKIEDIIWKHHRQLSSLLSASSRAKLDQAIKDRKVAAEKGKKATPAADFAAIKKITHKFLKGEFQRLQRIFTGPNCETLMRNFWKKCFGSDDGDPYIEVPASVLSAPCATTTPYEETDKKGNISIKYAPNLDTLGKPITLPFWKLEEWDFKREWDALVERQNNKKSGEKEGSRKWGKNDYEKNLPQFQGNVRCEALIKGPMGDEDAQKRMLKVREELLNIQKVERKDWEKIKDIFSRCESFWQAIYKIAEN